MENIEAKENNRLHYRKYKKVVAKVKLTQDMLGTDPGDEKVCLKHNLKQLNVLPRDAKGDIRLKPWWIRAGLRDTSNVFGYSRNLPLKYIFGYNIKITKNGVKPYIKTLTICPEDRGVKSGKISSYEVLPRGIEFEISCLIPTEGIGGIKPKLFREWLGLALGEGIGSIRKQEWGTAEIISFKATA